MSNASSALSVVNDSETPAPSLSVVDSPRVGGWQEGDPVAFRRFADLGALDLDNGECLPHVRLAYETWGTLNAEASNAVLILHALTGDAHVAGPGGAEVPGQPTPGWWDGIVGPGQAIDTERFFVVAANVLGGCQGSTGPSSACCDGSVWGSRFPQITTRDQVNAEALLTDYLGIDAWHTVVGLSLGGQRGYEWAVSYPQRVERLIIVASTPRSSAEQAAWAHTQIQAVTLDPDWHGGDYHAHGVQPTRGLALARQIAHTTYRSPGELEGRFANTAQTGEDPLRGGRLAVASYLDYHGEKLVRRFDAGSYVTLCRTMLTHDVGRGRGGLESTLGSITARTLIVSVDSDRLFFPHEVHAATTLIPEAQYTEVSSPYGHDGFLIETEQVAGILSGFLVG